VPHRDPPGSDERRGGLLGHLLQRLYPPTCVLCGATGLDARGRDGPAGARAAPHPLAPEGLDLCRDCLAGLPKTTHACNRCGLSLPADAPAVCGPCRHRPPPFAHCHAAYRYSEPLPTLVGGAKFRGRLNLVRLLGQCLAISLREGGVEMPDLIVPVPLHARRLRQRGYNQALEIARILGRELAVPLDVHSCWRVLDTKPQTGLEQEDRRRNVRGAFRVRRPLAARRVAIVDDVVTTGSTVAELSRVLLRAGVERVDVWAVARTP